MPRWHPREHRPHRHLRGFHQAHHTFSQLATTGGHHLARAGGHWIRTYSRRAFRAFQAVTSAGAIYHEYQKFNKRQKLDTSTMPSGVRNFGLGGTESHYTDKLKSNRRELSKLTDDSIGTNTITKNWGYMLSSTVGLQGATTVAKLFDPALSASEFDVAAMMAQASPTGIKRTGEKLYLQDAWATIDFSCAENTQCIFRIYEIRSRDDIFCTSTWQAGVTPPTPVQYWNSGMGLINPASGGTQSLIVGNEPFTAPMFTENWNVLHTTDVILSPGEIHSHHIHWAPNKLYTYDDFWPIGHEDDASKASKIMWSKAHLTHHVMVRQLGVPAKDHAGQATVSASELAMVGYVKYKFSYLSPNYDYAIDSNTLDTLGGTIITNPLTGARENYAAQ